VERLDAANVETPLRYPYLLLKGNRAILMIDRNSHGVNPNDRGAHTVSSTTDDPSVVAFASLVAARKVNDLRESRLHLATLRRLGWNIFCTLPRPRTGGAQ
jgi:hypothetical protein